MDLTEKKVSEMSNLQLFNAFYQNAVTSTKEVNFRKNGVTKATEKEQLILVSELSKRFDVDQLELLEKINQ